MRASDVPRAGSPVNDELACVIAQQKAMERGGRTLAHGCRLFSTPKGWESAAIQKDPDIVRCETLLQLEEGIRDTEKLVVFIPADAGMTDDEIDRVCHRNGVTKTLFREVEEE